MSFSRNKMVVAGALSVAALGLVGVGTGATFTDAVHNTQKVSAGTLNVTLAPDNAVGALSLDAKTFTFTDLNDVPSTFTSGAQALFINNVGTVPASAITLSASATDGGDAASAALKSQMRVKVLSWASPNNPVQVYDGTLTNFIANPISISGAIPVGGQDWFSTEFYSPVGGLTNAAMGGVVTPQVTVSYEG